MGLDRIDQVKASVVAKLKNEQEAQLGEQIDCFNLLSGQDEDRRAQDLRKVLILAGMKVEIELSDPETVRLISEVLENFDPNARIDEDEAMFSSRLVDFERKEKRVRGGGDKHRQRNQATKHVPESYHIERAKREKEEEVKRKEKEIRMAHSEELQKQFETLKAESLALKD